jgi:hypothetical protein
MCTIIRIEIKFCVLFYNYTFIGHNTAVITIKRIYMYIYIHIYIHIHTYIYLYIYTHIYSTNFYTTLTKAFCNVKLILAPYMCIIPMPVAARSKTSVCSHSLAGIAGSNLPRGMDVCECLCCQVEVSATG